MRSGPLLVAGVLAMCLLPLAVTPVLPSIDFYAHAVRYYALANVGQDGWLAQNYATAWAPLPNLGLDLIGTGLMMVLPPMAAAHVVAAMVIMAPVAGAMALGAALQGRVTVLTAALAGIMGSNLILSWGFSNFLFGLGLALGATAMWIRLEGRPWWRLVVAVPSALLIMLVHGLVFAIWGIILGAIELQSARLRGPLRVSDLFWRLVILLTLLPLPVLLFLQSQTAGAEDGVTAAFGNLAGYAEQGELWPRLEREVWDRLESFLRVADTSWPAVDRLFGGLLWMAIAVLLGTGMLRLHPRLKLAAIGLAVLVLAMPPNLFGVGHLDERVPLVLMLVLAAGLARSENAPAWPAHALAALFPLHLAIWLWSWSGYGARYDDYLTALDRVGGGTMATPQFVGGANARDASVFCKPLVFLMALRADAVVSTFANPTQQPLDIIGPLAAARSGISDVEAPSDLSPVDRLLHQAGRVGYDRAVVCGGRAIGRDPLAEGDVWAIYRM